jgi:hypothetical protein
MLTILAVMLAVAGSGLELQVSAADRQVEVDRRNPEICGAAKPGTAKAASSEDTHLKPPVCRQPRPENIVAERALAQTGLAIGLASTVAQSQFAILEAILGQATSCTALPGGGSVLGNGGGSTVTVYYDAGCTQRYIVATPNTSTTQGSSGSEFVIAETAIYYGLNGADIGTMILNESVSSNDGGNSFNVYGLGIFTPVSGARTPVQLGLYCAIGDTTSAQCGGGIAQNFPTLGIAIGAVTPLTLALSPSGVTAPVTFTGGGSTVTGAIGSLTLTNPSPTSLAIQGGTAYATTTASGGAAEFSLFPPTPTAWTLTDSAHDQEFSISVVSNTARNLTFKITEPAKGGTLAIGAIDQSGSGTITYSDGSTAIVTNWTLAD